MPVGVRPKDNALLDGSDAPHRNAETSYITKENSRDQTHVCQVHKIDRRMGENIWGRAKSPVNRREYGPGQHGQRRKGKLSDFGLQLARQAKTEGLLRRPDRETIQVASLAKLLVSKATPVRT